ncbi:hypothetical protein MMG00_08370 [Ignatzschineria rhizosphaerae]|uniref:Uncharacterized protein n=1 Tax=Ignatzschineria rhizosphaerae TaxID=2923279 RepID=A0ABY3WXB4_9GAMM|nr:hypothetical protein [Ignatzschineria rhizosphaerae]UNM95244.1 hypothetical protein MMG00_08370 [Ignatzschineria rhizosphaerae]
MPEFFSIPRLNRRLFLSISGMLWLLFLVVVYAIVMAYAPLRNTSLPAIMTFIMQIVNLQYYLLAFALFLMFGFSYGYIGRFKDAGISPLIALMPLLLFYGILILFASELIALLKESNLLLFMAKMKKFIETPSLSLFQGLFSPEWIAFLAEKKRWFNIVILLYIAILISAIAVPSQSVKNRYGAPKTLSIAMQFFSIILSTIFGVITLSMLYLCWQFWMLPDLADYLVDYKRFMQLLKLWQGQ